MDFGSAVVDSTGHQFGHFSSQLGDGRALLLGDIVSPNGKQFDIQLKGSGPTPYSRGGDGLAPLGPVLREYIVSEAMFALGVPTTRSLACVSSGDTVFRDTAHAGAVLTRVASSHIRVGTFQYFLARKDIDAIQHLADFVIGRHYPQCRNDENPYLRLLYAVAEGQASLVAQWLLLGFVHGVMNTDNTSIAGETIDYGPCAFLDEFVRDKVFSSIDRQGRYAYDKQALAAQWNIARFAETLLPLIHHDEEKAIAAANQALEHFNAVHAEIWLDGMRKKIGLSSRADGDAELVEKLLDLLNAYAADYTVFFRQLCEVAGTPTLDENSTALSLAKCFQSATPASDSWTSWLRQWRQRLAIDKADSASIQKEMRCVNPVFIPRNHQIAKVIASAENDGDLQPFHDLCTLLRRPYEDQPEFFEYAAPPSEQEKIHQTFCGT